MWFFFVGSFNVSRVKISDDILIIRLYGLCPVLSSSAGILLQKVKNMEFLSCLKWCIIMCLFCFTLGAGVIPPAVITPVCTFDLSGLLKQADMGCCGFRRASSCCTAPLMVTPASVGYIISKNNGKGCLCWGLQFPLDASFDFSLGSPFCVCLCYSSDVCSHM